MKLNHKAPSIRGAALFALAAIGLAFSGGAFAAGTPANTSITNRATLNYSVGNVAQPQIVSSPTGSNNGTGEDTTFQVDNKIVHTVATTNGSAVSGVPAQATVDLAFSVTNNGNAAQDYALTIANLATGAQAIFSGSLNDTFDVNTGTCQIRVDGNPQAYIANLAPDATANVVVRCSIPNGQVNNDIAGLALIARAAVANSNGATPMSQTAGVDTSGVDVVFADAAGSDDPTGARDGYHSARSAYRVVTASLLVAKAVTVVCDPLNGSTNPKNIPGAYVRYTITITNGGSAPASLASITDVLNTNVDFDNDLIQGTGLASNCVSGAGGTAAPSSAPGSGFRLTYSNRGATYNPKYMTTGVNSDGAEFNAGTITFNFAEALPADAGAGYAAGELKTGHTLTVEYQVKIK